MSSKLRFTQSSTEKPNDQVTMSSDVVTMEDSTAVPQKIKHDPTIPLLRVHPKQRKARTWKDIVCSHSQPRYSQQPNGGNYPSAHCQVNEYEKHYEIQACNGLLLSLKKEVNADTCYSMDDP